MSTIVFNDTSELAAQDVKTYGDYLMIKSLIAPAQLRAVFEDPVKTRKIQVKERGQVIAEYEGYTQFYRVEEYTGQIYGVTMYRRKPRQKSSRQPFWWHRYRRRLSRMNRPYRSRPSIRRGARTGYIIPWIIRCCTMTSCTNPCRTTHPRRTGLRA